MVWIERPDGLEHQRSFKLRDMTTAVKWSDNGLDQATKHNAELAVEAGLAEYRDDDADDEEAEDEDAGPDIDDVLEDADPDDADELIESLTDDEAGDGD